MSSETTDTHYSITANAAILELPTKSDNTAPTDAEAIAIAQAFKDVYTDVLVTKDVIDTTNYVLDWDATPPAFE